MDNLTHSLAGALIGQMGLKRMTGLAMPTLIIAANIPDIDAVATLLGTESLALRRGLTHGPVAMVVLPIVLTGIMLAWNRFRPAKQEVRAGWLLLCAFIGTLSHPALDWLNSYGIRLLEPFSSEWFAGDTLFIVDVWVWSLLGFTVWRSRRREKKGNPRFTTPAWWGFALVSAYIFGNGLFTNYAESRTTLSLAAEGRLPQTVIAQPVPVKFWQRDMLWRTDLLHGEAAYSPFTGINFLGGRPINLDDPALLAARGRDDVEAFLFWARMPVVTEVDGVKYLEDQRFQGSAARGPFRVRLGDE